MIREQEELVVVDYDPEWPDIFEELKEIYMDHLGDLVVDIEHVGSTAVPGLCAKPYIDIDIVIEDYSSFEETRDRLSELGYSHEGDLGIEGREAFFRIDEKVPWDGTGSEKHEHHLYVCPKDSRELKRHKTLRDHLREHPKEKKRYCKLKKRLARKHDNIEAYTERKTEFIEKILENRL
ncbi:MAG: GrpB family protein [Candidatus Thermoplasmatota archaeon]